MHVISVLSRLALTPNAAEPFEPPFGLTPLFPAHSTADLGADLDLPLSPLLSRAAAAAQKHPRLHHNRSQLGSQWLTGPVMSQTLHASLSPPGRGVSSDCVGLLLGVVRATLLPAALQQREIGVAKALEELPKSRSTQVLRESSLAPSSY